MVQNLVGSDALFNTSQGLWLAATRCHPGSAVTEAVVSSRLDGYDVSYCSCTVPPGGSYTCQAVKAANASKLLNPPCLPHSQAMCFSQAHTRSLLHASSQAATSSIWSTLLTCS